MLYLTVWGVEPVVTHQTSWLESTGAYWFQPLVMTHALLTYSPVDAQYPSARWLLKEAPRGSATTFTQLDLQVAPSSGNHLSLQVVTASLQ